MRRASLSGEPKSMAFDDVTVSVVRKRVKNVNLRVYPPGGDVVVSVPLRMPEVQVRELVAGRLPWIRHQRSRYLAAAPPPYLEFVDGEEHWLFGERHMLRLMHGPGSTGPDADRPHVIALHVKPFASHASRQRAYETWSRKLLRVEIERLLERWTPVLGVQVSSWGIKRMRTRWGTCNHMAGRIWLNSELVTRPRECLEYVVVHELAHLIVPNHGRSFWEVLDRHLPSWRDARAELGRWPLWADGRLSGAAERPATTPDAAGCD